MAHWASDVVAGFALGAVMERLLRLWTGYPLRPPVLTMIPEVGVPREDPVYGPAGGAFEALEKQMSEYVIRLLVGGVVVSAFAVLGEVLRPKSFAGLFVAAPSVALATLGIAVVQHGAAYASIQSSVMVAGAVALASYGLIVCHLLMSARLRALPATALGTTAWLLAAFGLWAVVGWQA